MCAEHDHHMNTNDDRARRRGSVLGALKRRDKGKDRARASIDDHERLREAAARSVGLDSILPELDTDDRIEDMRRRPPALDFRQAARDEAAAKLCGLVPPPLPLVPMFPCAQSALAAHTQLSGPVLKHQTPNGLARLVGGKAWKSRHVVFCTYALRNCSCVHVHRAQCDSATRTLACLHVFATPTPDALELARLIVTEDSVVFVVEPTLAPDDSRRPRDLHDRKSVFQVQGFNGAPPTPVHRPRRPLVRRRDSVGASSSYKSSTSSRPKTVDSLGLTNNSSTNLSLEDDARVHAVWYLQCPDGDARQRWISCIKRAVLLQRAERAGLGGTVHFASPRSVTDPLPVPTGDLDVVLAMRAQAHRGSTGPAQSHYASQPVTPMTGTFAPIPPITPQFAISPTTFTPNSSSFSPVSPLHPGSDHSHPVDVISLAFTRSQTPTYAPSVHTTATAPALTSHSKSRSRSSTVTSPVQALRGFFSSGSRPPSRSASVAVSKEAKSDKNAKRTRASSSSAAGVTYLSSFVGSKDEDVSESVQPTHPYYQSLAHPLGTPISAGLGSMDLSSTDKEKSDEGIGTPGLATSALPGLGPTALPTPGLPGLSILHAPAPIKPPNSAGLGKGLGTSLPPPPRARRAGSVSHVLPGLASALAAHGKDDGMGRVQEEGMGTVRARSEEEGRRPMLVPMLSLSFGRGEERERERDQQSGLDQRIGQESGLGQEVETGIPQRVLPPMLAPPSAPLPVPPTASGSSLALPVPSFTLSALAVGSTPALPGAWPSPYVFPANDGSAVPPTPSDTYQTAATETPTSPYSLLAPPDIDISPSTPSAYSVPTMPSDALVLYSTDDAGASYLDLSDDRPRANSSHPHLDTNSHLDASSHLDANSHLDTTPHLDTNSHIDANSTFDAHPDSTFETSHLDLSETTPQPNSTPFTSEAPSTMSGSSQASVYSVQTTSTRAKYVGGRLDALRERASEAFSDDVDYRAGAEDGFRSRGEDVFRSGGSDVFRSNGSDMFRTNGSDMYRSGGSDVFRSNGSDMFRTNGSDMFRTNGSDMFRMGSDAGRLGFRLGSRTSLDDNPGVPAVASRGHSRVSLAISRGVLREYPEGDGWDGDGYAHSGSGRDYSSVRESPTRTTTTGSFRAGSPIAFTHRSGAEVDDSPVSVEGCVPSGGLFGRDVTNAHAHVPRESFGSAFRSPNLDVEDAPAFSHPFSSASHSSPGRRSHRRAGSYAGSTLFTMSASPLSRSKSQRSKSEKLPPAAPPPSVPLPPTPLASRPGTPVSRPRTPSRPGTALGNVPPLPPLPLQNLRTRLRMLSTSSTPEPQILPPRDGPTEEDLAQPISRVPIQLLAREDSSARRSEHSITREQHLGTSLPPPPRMRPFRQHSYSASASDREGASEGRRSDESGKRGFSGARDSAVHLENRD